MHKISVNGFAMHIINLVSKIQEEVIILEVKKPNYTSLQISKKGAF